jgi:O-antigen/teichoic acid export membrane protein
MAKLSLGFLGYVGAGTLIGASAFGYLIPAAGLGWRTWRDDRQILAGVTWRRVLDQLNRYRKFPLVSSWSGLMNTLSIQLPVMLLSRFFSQATVGYYSFGLRVVALPMALMGQAVSQVFYQRASEARSQGTLHLVVQNTYARLVNLGLFPLLVLGLIGPELFGIVFGPEWTEAGVYAQILSLWRFVTFLGSPLSTLINVLERQEVGLGFNIVLLASRALALIAGGWLGDARLALALYAGSGLVLWAWMVGWLLRASGASLGQAAQATARNLLFSAPVLLVLAAAKWWWHWPAWSILLLACAGGLAYYGFMIRRDRSLMEPILNGLERLHKRGTRV